MTSSSGARDGSRVYFLETFIHPFTNKAAYIPMLNIDGVNFKDETGRTVLLRGVNLSGDTKQPGRPDLPSHLSDDFYESADTCSFIGRPFPLDEADEHLLRLKSWGYNVVRYVITWEAVEHAGPGKYDEEFIDYTLQILKKCREHNMHVIMDPHQDVWSRFSGGSGAPFWTLLLAGLNARHFHVTEAALIHSESDDKHNFEKMIWSTNYHRLAAATMFTLFFAGRDFAPHANVNGMNIQDYLQTYFTNAMSHFAGRIVEAGLADDPVIGWETLNEPNLALISHENLGIIPKSQELRKGTVPTQFQAMLLGMGIPCTVDVYDFGGFGPKKTGVKTVDPKGLRAWLSPEEVAKADVKYGWKRDERWEMGTCLWAQHGVWDRTTNQLVKPQYFRYTPKGEEITTDSFLETYFREHFKVYAGGIRAEHRSAILFCQPPVMAPPPHFINTPEAVDRLVYTPHYYDGLTLMNRHWNPRFNVDVMGIMRGKYSSPVFAIRVGEKAVRNCLKDQLNMIRREGLENMGPIPCFMSEIGIPYDMDACYAYKTGDFSSQLGAMDANHYALEGSGMNYTLWQYSPSNVHEWGDNWNREDLSLWSRDDMVDRETPATSISRKRRTESGLESPASTDSEGDSSDIALKKPLRSRFADDNEGYNDGARALRAFVRPAPIATAGTSCTWSFDLRARTFEFAFTADPTITAPTEIFFPELQFSEHARVEISSGRYEVDRERQVLNWWSEGGGEQRIRVVEAVGQAGNLRVKKRGGGGWCCPPCVVM
ncbi:hypothetical protein G7K_1767-t2 [Saitoella complicata NRRL Y-17804]|uniref:Glycoside hydrolase family 5 domain-containing protein n=1 Tax=Saitoella complicata (strain BCRC 22490 / CBS 7301 / JCM 7358 / NBRC 10748 / NRRL Y-17804) TaxID=698492 RepID=A0A0E9NCN6_SAICN|nr:hypothetical protein G7K_1767-t2 [Saitoella complicata NRRL Y-17804]